MHSAWTSNRGKHISHAQAYKYTPMCLCILYPYLFYVPQYKLHCSNNFTHLVVLTVRCVYTGESKACVLNSHAYILNEIVIHVSYLSFLVGTHVWIQWKEKEFHLINSTNRQFNNLIDFDLNLDFYFWFFRHQFFTFNRNKNHRSIPHKHRSSSIWVTTVSFQMWTFLQNSLHHRQTPLFQMKLKRYIPVTR